MRDTMLVWIGRSALDVIEEEDEMEKAKGGKDAVMSKRMEAADGRL